MKYACEQCRPAPTKDKTMEKNVASDLLFGFLSIVDQFGSVLCERGKEYRDSERGHQVETTIENLFSELDQTERETLDFMLSSLDGLLKVIDGYNQNLQDQTNGKSENGRSKAATR